MPPALTIPGFDTLSYQPAPYVEMAIEGSTSSGKTFLMLQSPSPTGIIDVDLGTAGVIEQFQQERPAGSYARYQCRYVIPGRPPALMPDTSKDDPNTIRGKDERYRNIVVNALMPVWEQIRERILAMAQAARDKKIRTMGIDGMAELWDLCLYARLGRTEKIDPLDRGPVNMEFQSLIKTVRGTGANLIVTSKLKSEWVTDPGAKFPKRTGRLVRAGFADLMSHFELGLRVTAPVKALNGTVIQPRRFEFIKCRYAASNYLEGTAFEDDGMTFQQLAAMVKPEIDPAVWE